MLERTEIFSGGIAKAGTIIRNAAPRIIAQRQPQVARRLEPRSQLAPRNRAQGRVCAAQSRRLRALWLLAWTR